MRKHVERIGADPKDKNRADGLRQLMKADDFKPNHTELLLIKKWILDGVAYSDEFRKEARNDVAFKGDTVTVFQLYDLMVEAGHITEGHVWLPTFAERGGGYMNGSTKFLHIFGEKSVEQFYTGMEKRGSTQGAGNGFWAGFIDSYLRFGLNEPERNLRMANAGGMASTLWPGNMCGTKNDYQKALDHING